MPRDDYDDSYVIIKKGGVRVQGSDGITIVVDGSAKHYRDPRLTSGADAEDALVDAGTFEDRASDLSLKWCSHKTHVGGRVLPITEFYTDGRYTDGHAPYCRACKAQRERERYAQRAAEQGKVVRSYRKRTGKSENP